ncbi:MAG TPA: galactose oxidase, partial [Actinomycetota bacterium]|nr:galactose oxidase [Actinomycetota bacterium]
GSRRVLVAGGADAPELYRERSRSFAAGAGEFTGAQSFPTATLLADGSVLVTGGYDEQVTATNGAWLFVP